MGWAEEAFDSPGCLILGRYLHLLYLEVMAVGALAAWLLFEHRPRIEPWLTHRGVLSGVLAGGGCLLYCFPGQPLLWGVLFAYLVLSVTVEGGIPLRSDWLDRLGRLSYGIYMLHSLVLLLVLAWVSTWEPLGSTGRHAAIYLLVLPATLGLSWLSYRFVESPCLRLKRRFAVIASGDDAAALPAADRQASRARPAGVAARPGAKAPALR